MKTKKQTKPTEETIEETIEEAFSKATAADNTVAGNCSKCNGPVISKWYVGGVRVGEYHECLNCGAKHFPSFGKTIKMDNDDDNLWADRIKKMKEDLEKTDKNYPTDDWTRWPYIPPSPTPCPNTPQYPGYPLWPDRSPYPYPIITCGTNTYTSRSLPGTIHLY